MALIDYTVKQAEEILLDCISKICTNVDRPADPVSQRTKTITKKGHGCWGQLTITNSTWVLNYDRQLIKKYIEQDLDIFRNTPVDKVLKEDDYWQVIKKMITYFCRHVVLVFGIDKPAKPVYSRTATGHAPTILTQNIVHAHDTEQLIALILTIGLIGIPANLDMSAKLRINDNRNQLGKVSTKGLSSGNYWATFKDIYSISLKKTAQFGTLGQYTGDDGQWHDQSEDKSQPTMQQIAEENFSQQADMKERPWRQAENARIIEW